MTVAVRAPVQAMSSCLDSVRVMLLGLDDKAVTQTLRDIEAVSRRPVAEGVPDTRIVPQRHADALIELCERARAAEEFPTTAGEPPHLTVTIDWDALRTALGTATLDYGQLISAADARRLACDCKLIPVVLSGDSEPLDVGRVLRTVPLGIRRALVARDGGCSFPGCDRPPGICAARHVRHWIDHGETSVHNKTPC